MVCCLLSGFFGKLQLHGSDCLGLCLALVVLDSQLWSVLDFETLQRAETAPQS